MNQIPSFQLVLVGLSVTLFHYTTGCSTTVRITQFSSARNAEEYEYNTKSARRHDKQPLQPETSNTSMRDIDLNVNESSNYDVNLNEGYLSNVANWLPLMANIETDDVEEKKKVFEEKVRADGFKKTTPKDSPYAVMLVMMNNLDFPTSVRCSGSLLTPRWVLTAGGCFFIPFDYILVYAGGNSLQELENKTYAPDSQVQRATSVFRPLQFTRRPMGRAYDIALVKMKEDFNLTTSVNVVEVSVKQWRHRKTFQECHFTGFGQVQHQEKSALDYTRKSQLLQVNSPCPCLDGVRKKRMLMCSEPLEDNGVYDDDQGGGLICEGKLVAHAIDFHCFRDIKSCERDESHSLQCRGVNKVSIFHKVYPLLPFIESYVNPDPDEYVGGLDDYYHDDNIIRSSSQLLILICSTMLFYLNRYLI